MSDLINPLLSFIKSLVKLMQQSEKPVSIVSGCLIQSRFLILEPSEQRVRAAICTASNR